jgi:hypothetical protein
VKKEQAEHGKAINMRGLLELDVELKQGYLTIE